MRKYVLLFLLVVYMNVSGQTLSKIRPVNFTAQQDSIVRSFSSEYRPMYSTDGHFIGYLKLDVASPSSTTSIMLQHNRITNFSRNIIRPGECSFLVLDPPPLFEQWGWTKPPTFFESVCDLLIDAIL